jgi:hypothetical protein
VPIDGTPLDVHELSAKIEGGRENRPPLVFTAIEVTALPHGTARDHGWYSAAVKCTGNVEICDAVET